MKYVSVLLLFFLSLSHAGTNQKLFDLYQKGSYSEACEYGYRYFSENKYNEPYISLLGFACLRADSIDRLTPILPLLYETPDARANGAYFSLLLMQKKLLMQALYDNKPITDLKLPTSSHLLSRIFNLYLKDAKNSAPVKEYQDSADPRLSYRLYTTQSNGRKSIAVDEYYDKILTTHHVY